MRDATPRCRRQRLVGAERPARPAPFAHATRGVRVIRRVRRPVSLRDKCGLRVRLRYEDQNYVQNATGELVESSAIVTSINREVVA